MVRPRRPDYPIPVMHELGEKRRLVRPLLSVSDPADALANYYALWHDPRRTELILHHDTRGQVDGFLAISQTGQDLFRPLVTLRAPDEAAVHQLLREGLAPQRSYQIVVPLSLAPALHGLLEFSGTSTNCIYCLDPLRFEPIINVLVQRVVGADGTTRFQIESQGHVMALSGTNWRSPTFAEVFVFVHPAGRGRGWGRSVVSACTSSLLEERVRPLYTVQNGNQASRAIAEALGYVDTGAREFTAYCSLALQ